jgi:hypothetical protein
MNNNSAGSSLNYPPLAPYKTEAANFISKMQLLGWNNALLKYDMAD